MSKQGAFSNIDKNQKSERPTFTNKSNKPTSGFGGRMSVSSDKPEERKRFGDNNGRKRFTDRNHTPNKQKGSDWYESSEYCTTNCRTSEVKWKEEFWTNKPPNVCMYEPKRDDGRGCGIMVPSNWKFQNTKYGSYKCRCGIDFAYECGLQTHSKNCWNKKN
jgi:hypothetical protein